MVIPQPLQQHQQLPTSAPASSQQKNAEGRQAITSMLRRDLSKENYYDAQEQQNLDLRRILMKQESSDVSRNDDDKTDFDEKDLFAIIDR